VGDDELLIAEAGIGGKHKVSSPEGDLYLGATGSVSVVYLPQQARNTTPTRIVKHLMSGAGPDGSFAVGSDGVAARKTHGPIFIQETYFPPAALSGTGVKYQNGYLLRADPYHKALRKANISRFELKHDPDGMGKDTDPYAVIARGRANHFDYLVADAAGNDVLRVDRRGHVHVWHVFPNVRTGKCKTQKDPGPNFPGCNFVPTSLATDREGHVYVGGLSSETPRQGRVVKLSADGRHVLHTYRGFTSVTGVAVSRTGVLYVSELEGKEAHPIDPQVTGVLTKISKSGERHHQDVPFPAGVAVNSRGLVFVVAWSISPGTGFAGHGAATSGQVWRMRY
jgi:hypothetical protein